MNKHQSSEEAKLTNGIVRRHDSLSTFFTSNTNTDVSFLDHGNVISSITDGKSHDLKTVLDHRHDCSFLRRADTTAEHGLALLAEKQELLLHPLVEHESKRLTINDQGVSCCRGFVIFFGSLEFSV